MSDIDKINDYVTHEQRPVTGDSHGNFVISPMGFPNTNVSGYPESGRVPTLFIPEVTTTPASVTGVSYQHKVPFRFLKFDDDNNMFSVGIHLIKVSDQPKLQLTFNSESIAFYPIDDSSVYHVYITAPDVAAQYKVIEGEYKLEFDNGNYLLYSVKENPPAIDFPDDGLDVNISYMPEDGVSVIISGQSDSRENGVYKIYVETLEDGNHYRWSRKGNVPDACFVEDVTYDGTENDNVSGIYDDPSLNHYRKGKSQQEVAEYLREALNEATTCGKFVGEQYKPEANGMLVKWFLGNGKISLNNSSHPVIIDSFGHVNANADVVGCMTSTQDESDSEYEAQHNKMHVWKLNTVGDTTATDWPYNEKNDCYHNNITLSYQDMESIGGRHNIVMSTDLSEQDGKICPKKTFIHLPTPLDLKDGTEYEFNISLPIVNNPTGDTLTPQKLSGYYSYVTQPRAYLLSGIQKSLDNNAVDASTLVVNENSFSFTFRDTLSDVTDITSIAYSLYNSYECQRKIRFVGDVENVSNTVTFHVDDSGIIHYDMIDVPDTMIIMEGTKILLEYMSDTITSDNLDGDSVEVKKMYRVSKVYHDYPDHMFYVTLATTVDATDGESEATIYRTSVTTEGKFPYDHTSRIWDMRNKNSTCVVDIKYVDTSDSRFAGLTERDNDSIFGTDPETDDIDSNISAYNQNFRIDATEYGKIDSDDKRVVIATVYPTATNTFPWRLNNRRRIKHLGLSTKRDIDYDISYNPLRTVVNTNRRIHDMLENMYHLDGWFSYDDLPIDYSVSTRYKSLIGSIVRVAMPNTLSSEISQDIDNTNIVIQSTHAFKMLVRDFKLFRIGYRHNNVYDVDLVGDERWFNSTAHSGDVSDVSGLIGNENDSYLPAYSYDNDIIAAKFNEWGIKLMHLPNCSLGVESGGTRRINEYATWSPAKFTEHEDYQFFFYTEGVTDALEHENILYDSKTLSGTTQMVEDKYSISSANGTLNSLPFNYPGHHSLIKVFAPNEQEGSLRHNQLSTIINGFLEMKNIVCGLRNTCYLENLDDEFSYGTDMFYPNSRVFSPDGIVFPDFESTSVASLSLSDDDIKKQIMAYPYAYVFAKDVVDENVSEDVAPVISMYRDTDELNDYVKSALPMFAQKMPFHMYNSFKYKLVYNGTGETIENPEVYYHEITLYKKRLDEINSGIMNLMQFNLNTNMLLKFNEYMTENHSEIIDANMTYQPISFTDDGVAEAWKDIVHPATLSGPNEVASAEYMSSRFNGCYTRVHVSVIFSAELGRWIVKDYYQIPTNYLTPAYGASTLGAMCKSYVQVEGGSPIKPEYRVPMSAGMKGNTFSIDAYKNACPEQHLFIQHCGNGTDYTEGMYKPYYAQAPMDINAGCLPFIASSFPYNAEGHLRHRSTYDFANIYDYITVPMDANGDQIGTSIPDVNYWSIKWHCRPARSVYPGAHIPTLESRNDETASISAPTLGMFDDITSDVPIPSLDNA